MKKLILVCMLFLVMSGSSFAEEIKISNAWVDESLPGQDTASIQFEIISRKDAKIIEVASGMAQNVEIHHVEIDGATMTMQKLGELNLPAKTPVEFDANGTHLMLIGLRKPLEVGHKLPFAITVKFADGRTTILRVLATIKPRIKEKRKDLKTTNA